jgi:hypothetical protein
MGVGRRVEREEVGWKKEGGCAYATPAGETTKRERTAEVDG